MTKVVVMLQDGSRSETFGLDLPELDAESLALVEDLAHELVERVQRLATIKAAKARAAEGRSP